MQRIPLILSTAALVIALLGSTPLGQAAGDLANAVPPLAKRATFARFAGTADNAKRLAGRKASVRPGPNQIPILGPNGKLPASVGAVGPQGPKGDKGDAGAAGPTGPAGVVTAYSKEVESGAPLSSNPPGDLIVSLPLPAGRYALFGRIEITSDGGSEYAATCKILAGSDVDTAIVIAVKPQSTGASELTVFLTHEFTAAGTVELRCSDTGGQPARWIIARVLALDAGNLVTP